MAALSRRKGHVVLLEALASVLEQVPEARLTLAGDGAERAFLEGRAAELGVAHAVEFLGAVEHDRMAALYEAADVFCLPSFAEGVPVVLMEAMAMEIPVVATEIMGVPELVEHEVSGLLVPPARPDLLADALVRLLGDPELRDGWGQPGATASRPTTTGRSPPRSSSASSLRSSLALRSAAVDGHVRLQGLEVLPRELAAQAVRDVRPRRTDRPDRGTGCGPWASGSSP